MTKKISHQKRVFLTSYLLLFMAGLGAFSSTKGCVLNLKATSIEKTQVVKKAHLRIINPLQIFSSRFL